jgi:hypothetical protein
MIFTHGLNVQTKELVIAHLALVTVSLVMMESHVNVLYVLITVMIAVPAGPKSTLHQKLEEYIPHHGML